LIDFIVKTHTELLILQPGTLNVNIFGLQLIERGFRTVDALEPNEAMLGEARKLGLYKNYYLEYITAQPCSLAEG